MPEKEFIKKRSQLCSEEYQRFLELLNSSTNIMNVSQDACEELSRRLGIARIQMVVEGTAYSAYQELDKYENYILYESGEACAENFNCYRTRMGNGKELMVNFFRKEGQSEEWTDYEKMDVKLFCDTLMIYGMRTFLIDFNNRLERHEQDGSVMNQNGLVEWGNELIRRGRIRDYAVFYMNIKNFKYINESSSFSTGNLVISEFCHRIKEFLEYDERLARLEGDNFLAIVRREREEEFKKFTSSIKVSVDTEKGRVEYNLSVVAGICEATETIQYFGVLIEGSMNAYVMAKYISHIDYIKYSTEVSQYLMHEKEVSMVFLDSLEKGEFLAYYQPKVDLQTYRLCGAEALVRWKRDGKILAPYKFVPILEKDESICKLDFYMFRCVCRDLREWLDAGITPVRISVNFSRKHLTNPRLAEDIFDIIREYQIDTKYLEIELTETTDTKEYDALIDFVKKIREKNIAVSIDDFGTGFSSVNLLMDLQVDVLKMDKSFLNSENLTKRNRSVIEHIVQMANDLDIEVVSEGVETRGQAEFLKDINCQVAQGYHFDRPIPKEEFELRLKNVEYEMEQE